MTWDQAIQAAEDAVNEINATEGDWEDGDFKAQIRWYHAKVYESVITIETQRRDIDAIVYAANRIHLILGGD